MRRGDVGPEPDRLARIVTAFCSAVRGQHGLPLLEQLAQAAPMPAITGPELGQVAEHHHRLIAAATALQRMRQLVPRLGPQCSGHTVEPDRLLGPRRVELLQELAPGCS